MHRHQPTEGPSWSFQWASTGLAHKPNQSTYSCVSSREYLTRDDKTYAPRCILRSPPEIKVSYNTDMCTYSYILTLTFEFCSYIFIRCMQRLASIAYLVHSAGTYNSKFLSQQADSPSFVPFGSTSPISNWIARQTPLPWQPKHS